MDRTNIVTFLSTGIFSQSKQRRKKSKDGGADGSMTSSAGGGGGGGGAGSSFSFSADGDDQTDPATIVSTAPCRRQLRRLTSGQ